MLRKILVVEDSEINRRIIRAIFEDVYDIIEAENGAVALEVLRKNSESISLILLDVVMPVMDGYEFLSIVHNDPVLSVVPVIITTQKDEDEIKALSAGATDFITKPYKAQVLKHRVASIIHLRENASMINLLKSDSLTGLYCKEFFYQEAKTVLSRNPGKRYDIICFDIQNFKLVNDIYGTKTGDELLCFISAFMRNKFFPHDICARLNSDIFAVMLEHRDHYPPELFTGIIECVNEFPIPYNLAMKFGIYYIEDTEVPLSGMCDRALIAIETIKDKYMVHFAFYDETMRKSLLAEQIILDNMEQAIIDRQFQIYFQPKYSVCHEKMAGAEALIRWIHPSLGFMSPGDFIPLFEKNGFITKLDRYVWEEACRALRSWLDDGLPVVPVSVNISRSDVYNLDLPEVMSSLVKKYNIDPKLLHLEITESAYTENPRQIIETVQMLRNFGFVIEMDDFGSGYSSLSMLSELPIDVLKLDMSFVRHELAKDDGERNILSFIISLAKWMDLLVISEGVETEDQFIRLRAMNCDYVQGYYFAKPMAEPDFRKFLTHNEIDEEACANEDHFRTEVVAAEKTDGKLSMLIIDDSELNRELLKKTFEPYYNIVEADNGMSAYKYADKNSEDIAIVLLDLVMPVMDGYQFIEQAKQNPRLVDIPVVVISHPGEGKEAKALKLGAADFVARPYDMPVLFSHINRVIELSEIRKMMSLQTSVAELLIKNRCRDTQSGFLNQSGFRYLLPELNSCRKLFYAVLFMRLLPAASGDGAQISAEFFNGISDFISAVDIPVRLNDCDIVVFIKEQVPPEILKRRVASLRQFITPHSGDAFSCLIGTAVLADYADSAKAVAAAEEMVQE